MVDPARKRLHDIVWIKRALGEARFGAINPIFELAVHDANFWTPSKGLKLRCQLLGMPEVIVIQKSDVAALCVLDPRITGCRHAGVLLPKNANARIIFGYRRYRPIDRPVIDHQYLEAPEGLGKDAANGLSNEALTIERGDNNADFRHSDFPFRLELPKAPDGSGKPSGLP